MSEHIAHGCPQNACRTAGSCASPADCTGERAEHRRALLGRVTHRLGTGWYEDALAQVADKLERWVKAKDAATRAGDPIEKRETAEDLRRIEAELRALVMR